MDRSEATARLRAAVGKDVADLLRDPGMQLEYAALWPPAGEAEPTSPTRTVPLDLAADAAVDLLGAAHQTLTPERAELDRLRAEHDARLLDPDHVAAHGGRELLRTALRPRRGR